MGFVISYVIVSSSAAHPSRLSVAAYPSKQSIRGGASWDVLKMHNRHIHKQSSNNFKKVKKRKNVTKLKRKNVEKRDSWLTQLHEARPNA